MKYEQSLNGLIDYLKTVDKTDDAKFHTMHNAVETILDHPENPTPEAAATAMAALVVYLESQGISDITLNNGATSVLNNNGAETVPVPAPKRVKSA